MNLKLKQMPSDMSALPIDQTKMDHCLIHGAFEESVRVGGKTVVVSGTCKEIIGGEEKKFITYIPEDMPYVQRCIVIAPPADCNPLEFLEKSGLKALADSQKLFMHLLVPTDGKWDLDGFDADYFNAVYVQIQSRKYYVTMQDNIYALGIGGGAAIAQQAVMKSTSEWSGLATFGDFDTEKVLLNSFVSSCDGSQDGEMMIQGEKCQLPVWMVFSHKGESEEKVIEYWKKQNNCDPEPYGNQYAQEIYFPSQVYLTSQINEENISQVRVTLQKENASFDIALFCEMWKYIGAARRHRSFGKKDLRYFKNPIEYGAVLKSIEHKGYTRIWYEYFPHSVADKTKPLPVVVCMHGRGGSAETFFDISSLSPVAEEREFIAIFPQASLYQQKPPYGLKNVLLWDFPGEDPLLYDNVGFIRKIIAQVKQTYAVDDTRIYCCGQSSGGMMSGELALHASDIFAAAAPWSGIALDNGITPVTKPDIPIFFMRGDQDTLGGSTLDDEFPFAAGQSYRDFLNYYIKRYELGKTPRQYVSGIYHFYEFLNDKGIPMVTFADVRNMPHANVPQQSWLSYDLFLSKWSKDKNGKLYYMNSPLDEKV